MATEDILFETRGPLGLATLNRPQQLNALTQEMANRLRARLGVWAEDPAIAAVAIRGAGEKGFCAGGDIRWLYEVGREDPEKAATFYRDEYRLNAAVARFPKPYVAFMDGVTMGGGVGVSIHGSHRVGGDATLFAMPETGIGLVPDVGGSYFLPRLPRRVGIFLGLTGARLRAADCLLAGVVDCYVPSARTDLAIEALASADFSDDPGAAVDAALLAQAETPAPAPLAAHVEEIERQFGAPDLDALTARLDAADGWALEQAGVIRAKSPWSLRATWRMLEEGARLELEDGLRMEFRLASAALQGHDFFEGVRAVVIDKDQKPVWAPATIAEVTDAMLEAAFLAPPWGDLTFT